MKEKRTKPNCVNVKPSADGRLLEFTSSFTGGTLTLTYNATVNAESGVLMRGIETMTDKKHGVLFSRSMAFAKDQVFLGYEFGSAVQGVGALSFIGERTRLSSFVYGLADGNELLPLKFSNTEGQCSCEGTPKNMPMYRMDDGSFGFVSIKFPENYAANLSKLIPVVEDAIKWERYSLNNIYLRAASGCFWASLACELAAKACIVGCPATGPLVVPCIALCLAAETACLLAVNESKQTTV